MDRRRDLDHTNGTNSGGVAKSEDRLNGLPSFAALELWVTEPRHREEPLMDSPTGRTIERWPELHGNVAGVSRNHRDTADRRARYAEL